MKYPFFIWAKGLPTPEDLSVIQRELPTWIEEMHERGVRLGGRELDLPETSSTRLITNSVHNAVGASARRPDSGQLAAQRFTDAAQRWTSVLVKNPSAARRRVPAVARRSPSRLAG